MNWKLNNSMKLIKIIIYEHVDRRLRRDSPMEGEGHRTLSPPDPSGDHALRRISTDNLIVKRRCRSRHDFKCREE
jgi:hypothetical protein